MIGLKHSMGCVHWCNVMSKLLLHWPPPPGILRAPKQSPVLGYLSHYCAAQQLCFSCSAALATALGIWVPAQVLRCQHVAAPKAVTTFWGPSAASSSIACPNWLDGHCTSGHFNELEALLSSVLNWASFSPAFVFNLRVQQ